MNTQQQLTQVFNDNFVAYFRAHVAHVNVVGRNFYSDHELLGGVYEELQGQIDIIAELIRSLDEFMPTNLGDVMDNSMIPNVPMEGSADDLLEQVLLDLETLKASYETLMEVADEDEPEHEEISNYAQERILALAKHIWQFRSTLA